MGTFSGVFFPSWVRELEGDDVLLALLLLLECPFLRVGSPGMNTGTDGV